MDCDNNCPVCLEELKDNVYITPCNHKFCLECVNKIHNKNHNISCPMCRSEFNIFEEKIKNMTEDELYDYTK